MFDIARVQNVQTWKAPRADKDWRGSRGRDECEGRRVYVGRRTRNDTKTMCLLSISGRTRWGFYESLGRARPRRSVVVYSRKESGPVAQMTLPSLRPTIPLHPAVTCAEIYGNSLFACFKGFRIILLPPFLLPPRVNLLYLPLSELFSACPFPPSARAFARRVSPLPPPRYERVYLYR